jgi:cysteine desulfurase
VTTRRIYLDWNATAPLRPEARQALIDALDVAGNPSSVHAEGRKARGIVETARAQVAALVGARADDVYFTSGATEANNWVLGSGWDTVIRSGIEHESALRMPDSTVAARVVELPVRTDGVVAIEAIADEVLRGSSRLGRVLVTLQAANSETGVLQPVAGMADFARGHGIGSMTDATQVAGRCALDAAALGVEYLTLSAHKLGGPKGVGALIARSGAPLAPMMVGGGQERRQRAGTENVAGIAAFGAAAQAAMVDLEAAEQRMRALRDRLEAGLLSIAPEAHVVGMAAPRVPNTTCVALPGRQADLLVVALDLAGMAVSAGSACSSGKVGRSATLQAMGLSSELAAGAIRISLGHTTTEDDIAAFLVAWQSVAAKRRQAA